MFLIRNFFFFVGSSKKIKNEVQSKYLPSRLNESSFTRYRKYCCKLKCEECGIGARFHVSQNDDAGEAYASSIDSVCDCEFRVRDENGLDIPVVIKVKMYREQMRSGAFKIEMEEMDMTLQEFKLHFMRCAKKYLVHHFNDVLSSEARRNMYEKMMTDEQLSTTVILASDYSAVIDGHSQDQLNQTTQFHSLQLVILMSYLCNSVLMTTAYSF